MDTRSKRIVSLVTWFITAAMLAAGSSPARAQVEVEAAGGPSLGVGVIHVQLPRGGAGAWSHDDGLLLEAAGGRVLYPSVADGPIRKLFRELVDLPTRKVSVYFLFRGNEPLELTLFTPQPHRVTVRPAAQPRLHRRLMSQWWREYSRSARRILGDEPSPTFVETYLATMLSRRLDLPAPRLERRLLAGSDDADHALGLLLGTESARHAVLSEMMLGGGGADDAGATVALPPAPALPPLKFADPPPKVALEPLVDHVPQECFYVRFGTYDNFLWFQSLMDQWGGDLRAMISEQAVDRGQKARMEKQLVLKQNALSKLFGGAVISDVAMIGTDVFFNEGAAFGFLFQARNSAVLRGDIVKQRAAALAAVPGCQEEKLKISGHEVSYLSTPDGAVRSYYAIDGDYHLVTTSRAIVARFYEAGAGKRPLAASTDFRYARLQMPADRHDAAFVYLSREFFHGLVSPRYRVEMRRRLAADVRLQLLPLARLAARAEQKPHRTVAELVDGGFLPRGFAARADGGRVVVTNGRAADSLRGGRGSFVPVPDVPIGRITRAEALDYQRFASLFEATWADLDPVLVGLRRLPSADGKQDRLVIDARVSTVASKPTKQLAKMLGLPSKRRLRPIPGDVIAAQVVMGGSGPLRVEADEHHVFAGLQDTSPLYQLEGGRVTLGGSLADLLLGGGLRNLLVGYLGSWPQPGVLALLEDPRGPKFGRPGDAIVAGRFGLWAGQFGEFTVLSFHRGLLAHVARNLGFEPAPRPAQAWLHVADPAPTKMAGTINSLGYFKARQISAGNLRFLHTLAQQLHVPRPQCREVAEQLLGARLVCPLGGKYETVKLPGGLETWHSTAWSRAEGLLSARVPADYRFPLLSWFRGLDADLLAADGTVSLHAEVVMQRKEAAGAGDPFDPFSIFGGGKKQQE